MPSTLRYSPRRMDSYFRTPDWVAFGPSAKRILDSTEAWNLAYLSHDYEADGAHTDPMFNIHVRRTTQVLLAGYGIAVHSEDAEPVFGSLLRLPAPRFVYLIRQSPILTTLPLYLAYGLPWVELIEKRSHHCRNGDHEEYESTDLDDAVELLQRIARI